MKLLAIDTAGEACSAALYIEGAVQERFELASRRQSELILPMMEELLAEAELGLTQLECLAFGCGPGAFTGLRIATGVIQAAAFAADLPVAPVSTLAGLAQGQFRQKGHRRLLPCFDARMQEVYWSAYSVANSGLVEVVVEDELAPPAHVTMPPGEGWHAAGSGWLSYSDQLTTRLGEKVVTTEASRCCNAHDIALLGVAEFKLGAIVAAEAALPIYLRDKVAWKKR